MNHFFADRSAGEAESLLLRARSGRSRRGARRAGDLAIGRVAAEGARWSELSELVADHVLGDEHGDELAPVVDVKFRPTNSGVTVERRDHVLMTRRSFALRAFSILS